MPKFLWHRLSARKKEENLWQFKITRNPDDSKCLSRSQSSGPRPHPFLNRWVCTPFEKPYMNLKLCALVSMFLHFYIIIDLVIEGDAVSTLKAQRKQDASLCSASSTNFVGLFRMTQMNSLLSARANLLGLTQWKQSNSVFIHFVYSLLRYFQLSQRFSRPRSLRSSSFQHNPLWLSGLTQMASSSGTNKSPHKM